MRGSAEEYVQRWTMVFTGIELFFHMLVIPVWFYWSFTIWTVWDWEVCFKGWITLDFVNILIIYVFTVGFALTAALVVPCIIVCCPCIFCKWWLERN